MNSELFLRTVLGIFLRIILLYLCTGKKVSSATEEGIPVIQSFNFPPRLTRGSGAKVLCNILHGKRPITFEWLKNGEKITESSGKQISIQKDFSMLTVDNINAEDAGNYTCVAKNSLGSSSHAAYLVVEASPTWIQTPTDSIVLHGSSLSLDCYATGLPRPRITWYRHGDVIVNRAGKHAIQENGTLQLLFLSEEDEGLYRCVASNGVGESIAKEIKITVNGIVVNVFVVGCVGFYRTLVCWFAGIVAFFLLVWWW